MAGCWLVATAPLFLLHPPHSMLHGLAIFISAFLLFQVQLIIGKRLLPWFGGAPAVWTTCLLFFQALLLAGYGYAHALNSAAPRTQRRVHLLLLLAAVAVIALGARQWGAPMLPSRAPSLNASDAPIATLFQLLLVSVGVPFFVLSTTSPLLQRWYGLAGGASPYRLYAASNAGSLLGLVSYPFAVEPMLTLRMQSWIWGGAFLGFVVLCLWCMRELPVLARTNDVEVEAGTAAKWSWPNIALWILLSAVTSALLLSVTNNLCQDIAVVPFLWVLPLVIYLLTFILCFESSRWYSRRWFLLASVIATAVVLVTNFQGVKLKIPAHVVSYSVFLFLFCMTCHGELVRLKPAAQHLTAFYLAIAAGGAAGALFVGLGAPVWFKGTWELHITLLLGWLALAWVFARDKSSLFFKGDRLCFVLLLALITYAVMKTVFAFAVPRPGQLAKYDVLLPLLGAAAIAALASLWSRRAGKGRGKIWPRVLVGAVIFIAECFLMNRVRSTYLSSVEVARNFYGTIRVTRHDIPGERRVPALYLAHGHISHGFQFLEPELRQMPTAYYSTNSGLGIALRVLPRRNHGGETNINIGVLGLGAGTIAAFAREHDTVRFYEINPAVTDLSLRENPRFTFVRECRGRATVAPGDARLALEQELARNERGNFDVLVMDAFAGDSVPVHLLTVEAVETYLQHMRDERGIIAVNISNRYLDFRDLMHAIAARFRMRVVIIDNRGDPPDRTPSRWCLFTRDAAFMELPEISRARMPYTPKPVPVWTDQFSNMLRLLL